MKRLVLALIVAVALAGCVGNDTPTSSMPEEPEDDPEKYVHVAGQNITVELGNDAQFESYPQHPNLTDTYEDGDQILDALLVNREGYTVCMKELDNDYDDPTEYKLEEADIDHIHIKSFDKFINRWNIEEPRLGDYRYRNRYMHPEQGDSTADGYWYLYVFEYIRPDADSLWVYADCWGNIFKISTQLKGGQLVP